LRPQLELRPVLRVHGHQEIRTLLLPLVQLRRTARRHGCQPVQGLRPRPALHQVRQRQVRRPALRADHVPKGASFKPTWWPSRASPTSATRSTRRSSGRWRRQQALRHARLQRRQKLGSGKEMVERLTNLIAIFENPALDFSKNRAEGDDILGDAYEYLMRHFATESGKSKGSSTRRPRSAASSRRSGHPGGAKTTNATTVYDPTCGSGSLLLKVGDEARTAGDALRAGEGRRHRRPRAHEHDPAQQPHALDRAGQHAGRPQVQGRRRAQDLRLRGRQSRPSATSAGAPASTRATTRSSASRLRRAARQAGRLRLPAAHRPLAQEHRQGRLHPAARRAVPRQCRGRHPPQPDPRATSRASSACRPTSSTAPASPPASSWWTSRRPPARASS
jgi:hypothetical protein